MLRQPQKEKLNEGIVYINQFIAFLDYLDPKYYSVIGEKLIQKIQNDYKEFPEIENFIDGMFLFNDRNELKMILEEYDSLLIFCRELEKQMRKAQKRIEKEINPFQSFPNPVSKPMSEVELKGNFINDKNTYTKQEGGC